MMKKRWISMLLAVSLLIGMWVVPAQAATSGYCGKNVRWSISDKILTISGKGPMYDYTQSGSTPWYGQQFSTVIVEPGVTHIGNSTFAYLSLDVVIIPQSVESIGEEAFAAYASFTRNLDVFFLCDVPQIDDSAFSRRRVKFYTFSSWAEEDKKNYGSGSRTWYEGRLRVSPATGDKLYALGESLALENVLVEVGSETEVHYSFTAKTTQIGAYDNSTYGPKSVTVLVSGFTIVYNYFVSDGTNHHEYVEPNVSEYCVYSPGGNYPVTKVTAGNYVLQEGRDYQLTYSDHMNVTMDDAKVTITGIGLFEGYKSTHSYAILKRDINKATKQTISIQSFTGEPITPETVVTDGEKTLVQDEDYVILQENDINKGTASVCYLGMGNYYGLDAESFNIAVNNTYKTTVKATYIGQADGELSDEAVVTEHIIPAGRFELKLQDAPSSKVTFYYDVYRLEGEQLVKVAGFYGGSSTFSYAFNEVYDHEMGGEVYAISYMWLEQDTLRVYAGTAVIGVFGKIPPATTGVMYHLTDDGDFRREYVTMDSDNTGDLGEITWTSSDETIATVAYGQVTFKKPGTVTVTGTGAGGTISVPVSLSAQQQDLTKARIFSYDPKTGKAEVGYDCFLLEEGTDYNLVVEQADDKVTVTIAGCGLFVGQLVRQFDVNSGIAADHNHGFDNCGDLICNSCAYTRISAHTPSQEWKKNLQAHYHICQVCGEKTDVTDHILSAEDETVCTVCGELVIPGDLDGNCELNTDDVIALLLHVSLPAVFPIQGDADFDGNGHLTTDDVIRLLLHISMPDLFPLA